MKETVMKKNKLIFALFAVAMLCGCEGYQLGGPFAEKPAGYKGGSMCKYQKQMQVEYAPQQYMSVPTCPMSEVNLNDPMVYYEPVTDTIEMAKSAGLYDPNINVNEEEVRSIEPIKAIQKEDDWDINPDDIEGDFPEVVDNKHYREQVIMQNLETRVLAFCRGTQEAIDVCVERLSCIGFERITNVPKLPAKYDLAPNKGYPARRWREGEVVPRW